jgi:LysM repeat protein
MPQSLLILFCLTIALNSHGEILNAVQLYPFFEKLAKLEKDTTAGKVNIVHIGDSHVQSPSLRNTIRKTLQKTFGNGGYGFVFPYGFFRGDTATGDAFRFFSNVPWRICRNNMPHRCVPNAEFGLSGYGFTTSIKEFAIKIEVTDKQYRFNTIKIVSTGTPFPFNLATSAGNSVIKNPPPSLERHVVKRGETLTSIAKKYSVSVSNIKDRNNMISNKVRIGNTLYIPIDVVDANDIDMSQFKPLEFQRQERYVAAYWQKELASEIYLTPAARLPLYNLNGIVLENDNRGIIYHGIGTVGSMASHFNATPLFFEQLPVLSPDLVIVSFGTNESYGKISKEKFIEEINLLVNNIRKFNKNVPIIVTTPSTSLLRGGKLNIYVEEYSDTLVKSNNFAVWDLYSFTGGLMGAIEEPSVIQIERDKMHYTRRGYTNQGNALVNAILHDYEIYMQSRKKED